MTKNMNPDYIRGIALQILQENQQNRIMQGHVVENHSEIVELKKAVNYLLEKAGLNKEADKEMLKSFQVLARSNTKAKFEPLGFTVSVSDPVEEKLKPTMDSAEKETKEEKK